MVGVVWRSALRQYFTEELERRWGFGIESGAGGGGFGDWSVVLRALKRERREA